MAGGNSIARMSVQLGANATEFVQVLDKAQGKLKAFGSTALKGFGEGSGGIGGLFSGLTGGLAGLGSLSTAALGFAAAAGAATGGAALLWNQIKKLGEEADNIHDTADALGATAHGLVGLQRAAGGDSEALMKGFDKLQRDIGDLIDGSEEATKSFAKLGLTAQDLGTVPFDEAVLRVFDKINEMPTQLQKGSAAFERFGKSGQRLLEMIGKGREFSEGWMTKAMERGLVPNQEIGAAYELMEQQQKAMADLAKGAMNRAVGKFAPSALNFANVALRPLLRAADNFTNQPVDQSEIDQANAKTAASAKEAFAIAKRAAAEKVFTGAQGDADKMIADLRLQADTLGMSAESAKLFALELKLSEDQLQKLAPKMAELADAAARLSDLKLGQELREQAKTPGDKLAEEYARIVGAQERGLINADQFGRLSARIADEAQRELDARNKIAETMQPQARLAGSAADYSFGFEAQRNAERMAAGGDKDVKRLLEKLGEAERAGNTKLDRIANVLSDLQGVNVAQF